MEIKSAKFIISNTQVEKCPDTKFNEYAFIGRSNVGKSSLINMLTGRQSLAMTSSTPGKTLLINHFLINDNWYLVDLPGYGFAKRSIKERVKIQGIIEDYLLKRQQLANVFVLIDIRIEPQANDLSFMEWLGEHQIPFSIVFTKTDKLKAGQQKIKLQVYFDRLKESWSELPPYFVTSAEKRLGRKELLDYIDKVNNNLI
ncbi:MAG: YihA family ribosome biogenesis GTP-binding protein [Bacteroidales bacterium]|nr:YihA family ribosome biogenesis GTP-binding protein [Bacteroidales bacterium]